MLRGKLTAALLIATAVIPGGAYAATDPHTPAVATVVAHTQPSSLQDLRSPDARDAARAPAEGTRVVLDRSAPSISDGFEWGDAGIGAGAMLALAGLASAALLLVGRNRGRTPTT